MDLKPYFDAARAADDETQRILSEMNTAFGLGTDEGKQQALALRPSLDVAKDQAQQANALYVSMRNAAQVSGGVAKNFVPVPGAAPESGAAAGQSLARADFVALETAARMAFIKNNGQLTD